MTKRCDNRTDFQTGDNSSLSPSRKREWWILDARYWILDADADKALLQELQLIVGMIRRLGSFFLVFEEFLVINDSHDWRSGICSDFDDVHAKAACDVESVIEGENSHLLSVVVDDADFAGPDFVVYTNGSHAEILIECWEKSFV